MCVFNFQLIHCFDLVLRRALHSALIRSDYCLLPTSHSGVPLNECYDSIWLILALHSELREGFVAPENQAANTLRHTYW